MIDDYTFEVYHLPGVKNVIPDTLSRIFQADSDTLELSPAALSLAVITRSRAAAAASLKGEEERASANNDAPKHTDSDSKLSTSTNNNNNNLSDSPKESKSEEPEPHPHLTPDAQLLLLQESMGKKIPPPEQREALIDQAHSFGHFGREAIYARLNDDGIWWKGMRGQIQAYIKHCPPCQRFHRGQAWIPAALLRRGGSPLGITYRST